MSRTSDILNKAKILREQHQNDIDKKLIADMQTALKDTENFVNQRVGIISNDLEQEIEQTQKSLQDNLQGKKTSIQANINTMGENLSKDTKALQESLKAQIKSMNADLQTLSGLSQATAEQAKLKKALFSSNIVLALIALTLLISSICLGYVSKSKYSDITAMENKVEYLKSEGGSLNTRKCGDEKDWRWCVQIDPTVEKLYNNKFAVVQETN
jgi:lipopolysaccharide export LptBFGC system permease protein LptF